MTTPRLRPELHATPIEEQGLKFFDVSDPRSGGKMRLYDFEWLLASQMDGHRSMDDIARWAQGTLHLDVSGASLTAYAEKLAELGFIAPAEPAATLPRRDPDALSGTTTPLPPPAPSGREDGEDIPLELSAEEDDTVTMKQEALPPRAAPAPLAGIAVEPTKQRPDEKTDRNAQQAAAAAQREVTVTSSHGSEVTAAPRSGSRSMIGLIVVLLIVGAVVAYVMLFGPGAASGGNKVSTQPAKPRDLVALYDGSAKVDKGAGRALSFGEAGKVTDVVAAGTEVKPGMPLATLEGFAKVEKELADVKDRLGFYQKQLDAATQKGDEGAQKAAEGKVAEKKKLLAELEARAMKLRLVAPTTGVVAKVNVAAGGEAKPDAPAIELSGNGAVAVFSIGPEAAAHFKVGDEATLQTAAGASVTGKVAKVAGGDVTVDVGDAAKAGDELRLVKSKLAGVVAIPQSAIVKKGGADVVFVLSDGAVHAKSVTVADRAGQEAFVSAGLAAGDQVVTTNADKLNDGDKASANQ